MRRIVRLVIVLSVLAAFAAPAAVAAPSACGSASTTTRASAGSATARRLVEGASQTNATIMRLLVQWNLVAKTRPSSPTDPFDPRTTSTTSTRPCARRRRTTRRSSSPSPGRRAGRTAARTRTSCRRASPTSRTSRARSPRATRAGSRGIRSCGSTRSGTSRTSSSFLAPQFNAQGKSVAPANYAKLAAAAYTGIKAGNRQAQVAIGETSARGSDKPTGLGRPHAGQVRRARREGEPAPEVRRVVAPPVSVQPELASDAAREVAERLARICSPASTPSSRSGSSASRCRSGSRSTGTRPGPRTRSASRTQAGRVHPAVDLDGVALPVRADVHLVRLPGRPGQPWESGIYTRNGTRRGRRRPLHGERAPARRAQRRSCSSRARSRRSQRLHPPVLRHGPTGRRSA